MHPYAIDRMVQERQEELFRLARAGCSARAARGSWLARRRSNTGTAGATASGPAGAAGGEPRLASACCPG